MSRNQSSTYRRILVPLDGSSAAEAVLPWVECLAARENSELILLHVLEPHAPALRHGQPHLTRLSEAQRYLEDHQKRLCAKSFRTRIWIIEDGSGLDLPSHMVQAALDTGAGLIALCTHGRTDPGRWLFGSIAQRLMTAADLDIFVLSPEGIRRPLKPSFRRLLVPLDGETSHEPALARAAELANQTGAELALIHITGTRQNVDGLEAVRARLSPRTFDALLHESRQEIALYLEERSAEWREHGLRVTTALLEGNPLDRLAELASNGSYDLVVLASHGHLVSESTPALGFAPAFSLKSPIPVLIVPAAISGVH
jgi:nucleotide-binding universal stress UspA family protein